MAVNTRSLVQRNDAQVESLPSPIGGWNARDSYANMDPMDAVTLINLFPTVSGVNLRGGYTNFATGLDGQVQTLMAYSAGAVSELWAITDSGKVYNVSAQGAVGAPAVTGLTNGIWEYTNITTSGGSFIYAVNGYDKPMLYNGTTWTRIDSTSTPAITGVTSTTLCNVLLWKHYLWFIQKDTLKLWYLPVDSIGGAASMIDLSQVARFGGHLVDMETWTLDAGYGADDNIAFMTSKGEVIVYSGTNPNNASTFALIGVWKLGSPIGPRATLKWGGDVLLLTYDGLMPLAGSLQSSRLDPRVSLSDKIQGAIAEATTAYGGDHAAVGWQVFYSAKNNAVWINVPVATGSQEQYVMNTITKAWCKFQGWAANCWEIYNDDSYFGGNGIVGKAWDSTFADNGTNVVGTAQQAFNYFGSRGVKKYFTRARPSFFTNGVPAVNIGMNVDFDVSPTGTPVSFATTTGSLWDTAWWDQGIWGLGNINLSLWQGVTGLGYCGSLQLTTASKGIDFQWASTDVVYQSGWAGI